MCVCVFFSYLCGFFSVIESPALIAQHNCVSVLPTPVIQAQDSKIKIPNTLISRSMNSFSGKPVFIQFNHSSVAHTHALTHYWPNVLLARHTLTHSHTTGLMSYRPTGNKGRKMQLWLHMPLVESDSPHVIGSVIGLANLGLTTNISRVTPLTVTPLLLYYFIHGRFFMYF